MIVAIVGAAAVALLIPVREVPYVCPPEGCPFLDVPGPTHDYQLVLRLGILGTGLGVALFLFLVRRWLRRRDGGGRSRLPTHTAREVP